MNKAKYFLAVRLYNVPVTIKSDSIESWNFDEAMEKALELGRIFQSDLQRKLHIPALCLNDNQTNVTVTSHIYDGTTYCSIYLKEESNTRTKFYPIEEFPQLSFQELKTIIQTKWEA